MAIRSMNIKDLQHVIVIEQSLFGTPWGYEDFLYELKVNPYGHLYVYELDGQIIGFIGMWFIYEDATITTLGVAKEFQRRGYAKELMDYAIKRSEEAGCEKCTLEVRVSNVPAIKLYESYGFKIVAIRKNYYTDTHEDAYLMLKGREDIGNDISD